MRTITEHIRRHLLDEVGIVERPNLFDVVKYQRDWSAQFMQLMTNRIIVGHFRYGPKDLPVFKDLDYITSMNDRLSKYKVDGNLEHLVDIANIAMLEFYESSHPKKHFKATDDGDHIT